MRISRKKIYRRNGGYTEVTIDSSSSYEMVAQAAADALQLEVGEGQCLKIFRCNGTMVSDGPIPTSFGQSLPWTWKGYISLISKYNSQLKMGVGCVYVS